MTPKVGGLVDAPADGVYYGRLNGDWAQVAPLVSPAFSGNPIAPTPAAGNNGPSIATTAFVQSAVAAGGGGGGGGGGGLTPASNVIVTPTGQINATDAQAAFAELDSEKVAKAGDTMAGPLTLSGAPTAGGHATTKDYVDTGDAARVAKAGDVMTGALTLSGAPTLPNQAATKDYVDTTSGAAVASKVAKAGDTMTGALTLSGAPTAANHAATKTYVDGGDSARVAKGGDTMTGALTLSGAPTAGSHAATKDYVDGAAAGKVAKTGDTMSGDLTAPNLLASATVRANAYVMTGAAADAGTCLYFGSTGGRYLTHSGGTFTLVGGALISTAGSADLFRQRDGSANLAWVDRQRHCPGRDLYANRGNGTGVRLFRRHQRRSMYLGTGAIIHPCIGRQVRIVGSGTFAGSLHSSVRHLQSRAMSTRPFFARRRLWWRPHAAGRRQPRLDLGERRQHGARHRRRNPPTVQLTLATTATTFEGNLNVNGTLLNVYGGELLSLNAPCITRTAPFTTLYDDQGNQRIILGNNASVTTYHRNVFHNFQDAGGGNQYFGIDPGGDPSRRGRCL